MLGIGTNQTLPTVLIIDDDMVSREVMATVLTMSGYSIHTASEGADALTMLDAENFVPEVILMDTQMPGLKGIALVGELRKRCKASIYAMSGSDVPEELKAAVDGHLSKPFGPQALQQLIEQHHEPPRTPIDSDAPVVSAKVLSQLRGMMPESSVREIYAAVVSDLDKRASAIQRAMAAGDFDEIRRIGHSIKGGCGMAGAMQAAHLGSLLETRGDHLDNVYAILLELKSAGRNLRRMLDTEFPA
ncbi:MAG TPA: response regulator [Terracidiphilus sp.]|jgi:CheY-like chemotaxis protein/HPt (histidine-containing phosphotransfer) domain-containing protein